MLPGNGVTGLAQRHVGQHDEAMALAVQIRPQRDEGREPPGLQPSLKHDDQGPGQPVAVNSEPKDRRKLKRWCKLTDLEHAAL